MILFGLYSGQRLGNIATLRWNKMDLAHGELRFSARKTEKTMILPLAQLLRKHVEPLSAPGDPSAPVHPKAFDLLERHHITGNLSNQFAELLAAAGLRRKRNHKSRGKGRGSRERCRTIVISQSAQDCDHVFARGWCSCGTGSSFNWT